jgi:hypothetical protein
MDLAKAFDAKLQATILSVGNVATVRAELAKRLAETINARHPDVPVLLAMKTADSIIDTLLVGTIEHFKGHITPAEWGEHLANPALRLKLYESGVDLFQKGIAQVRYEKRIANGQEFTRGNTQPRDGVAIDGKVYGR